MPLRPSSFIVGLEYAFQLGPLLIVYYIRFSIMLPVPPHLGACFRNNCRGHCRPGHNHAVSLRGGDLHRHFSGRATYSASPCQPLLATYGLIGLIVLLAYDLTLVDSQGITNLMTKRRQDIVLGTVAANDL